MDKKKKLAEVTTNLEKLKSLRNKYEIIKLKKEIELTNEKNAISEQLKKVDENNYNLRVGLELNKSKIIKKIKELNDDFNKQKLELATTEIKFIRKKHKLELKIEIEYLTEMLNNELVYADVELSKKTSEKLCKNVNSLAKIISEQKQEELQETYEKLITETKTKVNRKHHVHFKKTVLVHQI